MTCITCIMENGQQISDSERYERAIQIIEEYDLEIMFSIALKQKFDWVPQGNHARNVEFANNLSRSHQFILTEIIECAFMNIDEPTTETQH